MERVVHSTAAEERLDDPDAFAAFYERAVPRIYGYFVHRCGAAGVAGVAEELTQETFLTAVTAIRSGRPVTAPLPWLFGIARHKLLDHYRREARIAGSKPVSWEAWRAAAGEADEADLGSSPWQEEGWRERTLAALAALPAAQRQALVLRHLDELSVPEVAAALGRSVHAVESLLARGRAGFKRAYAASEVMGEAGDG